MPARPRPQGRNEIARENLLRPNPFLGYNHDTVALHLLERGAYALAEAEFRRAIWLNPFEPEFLKHLAWCLFRQHRFAEARECADHGLAKVPDSSEFRLIQKMAAAKLADNNLNGLPVPNGKMRIQGDAQ